jgi:hypothetical protein
MSAIKEKLLALLRILRKKRIYVTTFVLLLLSSIIVGLDNPTGIILGWLAITVLAVALARRWRKPWYFLVLLAVSIIGAIILLVTPVGILVGFSGFIILSIWRLYERRHQRDAASGT